MLTIVRKGSAAHGVLTWLLAAAFAVTAMARDEDGATLARPSPEQAAWQDMEIGMMLCFGLETYQDIETDDFSTPLSAFNPMRLDTDQWLEVAESFGAKYVVLVAKHAGGFCLWQTDTTDYGVKNTPWRDGRGDIVADLAESCRKRGIKLGIYLSPADGKFGAATGGRVSKPEDQERYNRIYRQQLTELLTRYGEVFEVWFDGSCVIEVGDILEKYAPGAMVFQGPHATIRWVGNERGFAPYPAWNSLGEADARTGTATARHGAPDGDAWLPNEVDTTFRDHYWFWSSTNADKLKSLDHLMDTYYRSVGHGAVLLLNQTPDPTGLIPEGDVKRAAEFGAEIRRRFGRSIAETHGQGKIVELSLDKPAVIDHVIAMEDITRGERVREYIIEGWVDGNWREIVRGTAIGHKKIDRFDPVEVSKLRLRVIESAATPIVRRLAVFNVSGTPKDLSARSGDLDFQKAGGWTPQLVRAGEAALEIDLSPLIDEPTQYEVIFRSSRGEGRLEILSIKLILNGVEAPQFIQPLQGPNAFNVNITGTPSGKKGSIVLRANLRVGDERDATGEVLIRKRPL